VQKPRDKRPADGPRSFGQYTLLDKIATGGMAEVWKARMLGMEGFQKNVAIKRILPHLTDSSDFLTMFIDEAKLAAQLNHNNIIHIYDLGKIEEDYYIAMEFVDGRDLRSILNSARRKQPEPALPMSLALLVAARLASALDYAHRKKDFDGRELGLVHRDVSPQNVLISYEGDIKLCDFGIVKAVAKASKTQMGALKGKLQYMSPEQAWGRVVDARSDIFSLGAVLFEMLTGRRLFAGESEISVLESVRDCRIESPRSVNPAIPESVDKVVMRALAGEPDDRYQTAGEMQKELERVLYGLDPTPSERDLALYLRGLFDDAPATPLPPAAPAAAAPADKAAPRPVEMPTAAGVSSSRFDATGADPAHSTSTSKGRYLLLGGIAAALLAAAGLLLFGPKRNDAAPVQEAPPPAVTSPEQPTAQPIEAPAPAAEADLQALVQEQVAAQETLLRESLEAEKRALEEQVRKAQAEAERQQAAVAKPEPAKPEPAKPEPSKPEAAKPEPAKAEPPKREPVEAQPLATQPEPETKPAAVPAQAEPTRVTTAPPRATTPPPAATAKPTPPAPAPAPATKTGDLVAMSDPGVTPPKLLDMRKPDYPPMARRLKVQGTVVITVLVDENGAPSQPRIVRGVDQNVGINEAALAAIQTARFTPATKDGVKVKVWYTLSMPFRL
jgi:TonB family protein